MTPPVRPEPTGGGDRIARNIEAMRSQGATEQDIEAYLTEHEQIAPVEKPGVLARAGKQIGGFFQSVLHNPGEVAASLVTAPLKSAADAFLAPGVGEARPDPRLSKGGNSAGVPIDRPAYDAEHGGVTGKERALATGQTLANLAFPAVAGKVAGGFAKLGAPKALANVAGLSAAGGVASATYSPDDPLAGAVAGATLAPLIAGAVKGVGKAGGVAGSKFMDLAGRPAEAGPLIKAGPLEIGQVEGVAERAARKNAARLDRAGLDASQLNRDASASGKPLAAVDLAGIEGQRAARGLKTSSPPAETALREALAPRTAGAVDRVIEHGLETTGLTNRVNGLQTVDDLIAQRAQHGNENFPKTFEKYPNPLDDPEFAKIAETPAGKLAIQRGQIIAANRFQNIGTIKEVAVPPEGITPEAWANLQRLAKERGLPLPENPNAPKRIAPTLEQAHFIKLGFDDMLASPPEPGSGGSGPVNTEAIRTLKNQWRNAASRTAKEYGEDLKLYADESDLIRAAQTGRDLWKMHPDEAAKAFREMSAAERDVARRTGFDALSERIENGPKDVSAGASKPRDVKRMRLLFPDDASFETFRQGLEQEAKMLTSNRAVLDGSNTADKIADMADMAGVVLPDIFRAFRGNPLPLMARGAKSVLADKYRARADAVAAEQARQLTAGANGDAVARKKALDLIGSYQAKNVPAGSPSSFAALLPPTTTPRADQGPDRPKRVRVP